jgi:hypothetical protein
MRSAPRNPGLVASLAIALAGSGGCAVAFSPPETRLNEYQIADMVHHPKRWFGRIVTVRIYPYDNSFTQSYRVCFERCDPAHAERSGIVIYTGQDRFKGYRGDRPAVVRARYHSACVDRPAPGLGPGRTALACPDDLFLAFTEVD